MENNVNKSTQRRTDSRQIQSKRVTFDVEPCTCPDVFILHNRTTVFSLIPHFNDQH